MLNCPDGCGKEHLVWVQAKSGDWVLYELGPPHFVRCKKRPKKDGQPSKESARSVRSAATEEAVAGLVRLGIKLPLAQEVVAEAKATDIEGILREAFKALDALARKG